MHVNGVPQWKYITKEDAASPTVEIDSIFITSVIDAHKQQDVTTCDLPGAFPHTVTDKKVIMVILMVKVDIPEICD